MSELPTALRLDVAIAEKVMNHVLSDFAYIPRYSTDIAAAWEVVEKLKSMFRRVEVHVLPDCACCLIEAGTDEVDEHYIASVTAQEAPEAICKAALEAVGSLVDD